mmetsp:Transcript_57487/g.136737  ORF Transcript_57487/g.136737 Transcript_57487/m.136737 type:complete len:529 (-) Transcript_57487:204-1790(-)
MAEEPACLGGLVTQDGSLDMEQIKVQMIKEFEARLEKKEEELWRRGQAEMRKLQQEQQQMNARMAAMQDRETSLVNEMSTLRGALMDVTSKFETVVKDMREVLRTIPGGHRSGMSPSAISTTASPDALNRAEACHAQTPGSTCKGTELLLAGSQRYTPTSAWAAHNPMEESSIAEMPSFDKVSSADCRTPDFCTPPRSSGPAEETALPTDSFASHAAASSCSPAVLSLANALPSALPSSPLPCGPAGVASSQPSPGLKRLQLAEHLDCPDVEQPSPPSSVQAALARGTPSPPRPYGSHKSGGTRYQLELIKEQGFVTLGMEVNPEDDETLFVKAIDEHGLVAVHNLRQDSDDTRILVGDKIVQVNDVSNSYDGMLSECKYKQHLTIVVLRPGGDSDDSAEESASETSKVPSPVVMRLRAEAQAFVPSTQKEAPQTSVGAPPGLERHEIAGGEGTGLGPGAEHSMAAPSGYTQQAAPLLIPGANPGQILAPYLPAAVTPSCGTPLATLPPAAYTVNSSMEEEVKRALFP